jgi:hypothetical protein
MAEVFRAADRALDAHAVFQMNRFGLQPADLDINRTLDQVVVTGGAVRAEPDVELPEGRQQGEARLRGSTSTSIARLIKSSSPPRMMKRTLWRTIASRSGLGRSTLDRGSAPPSEESLAPRPTPHLSCLGEERAVRFQAVEPLLNGKREHLADQLLVVDRRGGRARSLGRTRRPARAAPSE